MTGSDAVTLRWRNPAPAEDGSFDVEVEHPRFGWIPFTARADDPAEHGRRLHAEIAAALRAEEIDLPG